MQQTQMNAPIALLGTQLQDRYVIESLLGQGGFSAVYMARDLKESGKCFAVKELRDHDAAEKERFLFECEVLKRLDHPALPSVSHVFEENGRIYMLMEYIEGSNLEVLRRRQAGQRCPLPDVLKLLAPVAGAITYLHTQPIPILHRDIKPANIIVQAGEKTVLVDLGIAKEYDPDATTTAIRHCSPGYGAPEQYSGLGTDQRTDIYGLGATCYALLTGIVPIDALQRTTVLVTKGKDPLAAVNELVPSLSPPVARVLQRALAIGNEQRFATIAAFWQALEQAATQPSGKGQEILVEEPVITEHGARLQATSMRHTPLFATPLLKLRLLTVILVAVLLSIGAGGFLSGAFVGQHTTTRHIIGSKIVPTALSSLPVLNQQYQGTVNDLLTHTTTTMTLTHLQQHGQVIEGNFSGLRRKGTFTGVLDTSRHLFFTLTATKYEPSLFFEGSIRMDKYLVGNYCRQDQSGQCVGDYGIWSITPVASSTRLGA